MGLKHKKAVIFDLDGTLVDSMWMWKSIDVEYLDRYGYDCPEDLSRSGLSCRIPWRKSRRPGRKCPLKNTGTKYP